MRKEEEKLEGYLKDIQNVGEMIGEVLKEDEEKERCKYSPLWILLKLFSNLSLGEIIKWTEIHCGFCAYTRQSKAQSWNQSFIEPQYFDNHEGRE